MTHSAPRSAAPGPNETNAALWARLNLDTRALVSAHLHAPHTDAVAAVWSQRDPISSKKRHFHTTYTPTASAESTSYVATFPIEISAPVGADLNPSPSHRLWLRFTAHQSAASSGAAGLIAEVWSPHGLHFSFPIPESVHGAVYTADEWFGPIAWSPDETLVAYIADAPPPLSSTCKTPETQCKGADDATGAKTDNDITSAWATPLRHKFSAEARGPFGETYTRLRSPALFIANICTGSVALAAHPAAWHLGQPAWSSNGWIVCTARRTGLQGEADVTVPPAVPDDLGLVYCYNRMCALMAMRAPADLADVRQANGNPTLTLLTDPTDMADFCCTSPRFSPDSRDLIYVSAPHVRLDDSTATAMPHNATKTLRYIRVHGGSDVENTKAAFSKPLTLMDVPRHVTHGAFPGLYLHGLVARPWLRSDTIVLATTWGSATRTVTATFARKGEDDALVAPAKLRDLLAGSVTGGIGEEGEDDAVAVGLREGSVTLLDVCDGAMLVSVADAAVPTQLAVVRVGAEGDGGGEKTSIQWVCRASPRAQALAKLVGRCVRARLVGIDTDDLASISLSARPFNAGRDASETCFEATLVLPAKGEGEGTATPLVVFPHGGPHTASVSGFTAAGASLAARGFAVLYVNYRGSTGLGQVSLESLLGRIGTQDVNEVVQATRWAIGEPTFGIDVGKVVFIGGSHSGFLGAHVSLIEGLFQRTVLRNPVVDVATMVGATDIPDWCLAEAGLSAGPSVGGMVADGEQLRVMFEKSPVSRVAAAVGTGVYPRTLLQVGGSDRRVPPEQSVEWRRVLTRAFGEAVVSMRWYEASGHAIAEVPEGDDAWVHALDFVCEVLE